MKFMRLKINYYCLASGIVLALLILSPAPAKGLEDKIVFVSKRNGTPEVFLVEGLNGRPIQLTQNRFASWPSISPDGTKVVFVSRPPDGISNFLKLHLATNRIEKLTNNREFFTEYSNLDWSPDGRQILFIKNIGEKTDLCVMDMKTRDIRHIVQQEPQTYILHPSWSPDSQHILYAVHHVLRGQPDLRELFITDDNGNRVKNVEQDLTPIESLLQSITVPAWSPKRSQAAFIGFNTVIHTREIYTMNLEDKRVTALTSGGRTPRVPLAWRPDGRKILFSALTPIDQETESGDIYIMAPDGENMINLTQSPEMEWSACWSPDGRQIAFSRTFSKEEISIFVMDANGQNQRRLTFKSARDIAPHWSPDGGKIAFNSNRDGSRRIYTMDANGQNLQQITHHQRKSDGAPAWSPDGRRLAFGSGNEQSWGIYLIAPQGGNETLIIRSKVSEFIGHAFSRPTWSADSQHLIYIDPERDDDVGLTRIRVDGGMSTELNTEGLREWSNPLWSPDGNRLLFSAIKSGPSREEQKILLFLMNLNTSERRHFILPGIAGLFIELDFLPLRLVWSPDGSQLMLSIGETRIKNQGRRRVYLIDIASETVRLWMDDAAEADWVRPGFVYAVNPRQKRIATWAQIKTRKGTDARVIP